MTSTMYPPLVIRCAPSASFIASVGGIGGGDLDHLCLFIYVNEPKIVISPGMVKGHIVNVTIHRQSSQTLLDLLAGWETHRFDMPIYDCLLEEYPEIEEYLK